MKKILFLLCALPVFGLASKTYKGKGRTIIAWELRGVTPNSWLECALLHESGDVYGGLGPYSDGALQHALDALTGKANPNGRWEDSGKPYLVGLGSEFTELLLEYGADPDIDNGAALEAARQKNTPDSQKVVQLLLTASKNKNKRRSVLRTLLAK